MTMATPTRTRTRTRSTSTRTQQRPGRPTAAQKAYARRAQRTAAVDHGGGQAAPAGLLSLIRLPQSRASFVLLMMSLLAAGVGLTLWLSTQAIADSYRLDAVRAQTAHLSERAERLQREVARAQTVAALDDRARALGMVPSGDPARILVTPNGKKKLIGEPTVAQPAARPAPPQQANENREQPRTEQRERPRDDEPRRERRAQREDAR